MTTTASIILHLITLKPLKTGVLLMMQWRLIIWDIPTPDTHMKPDQEDMNVSDMLDK